MSTLKLTTPNLVRPCASRSRVAVRAAHGDKIARRDLLLGSAGAAVGVAASLWVPASASAVSLQFSDIPVESLSAPQVRAQQEAYRVSCEKILRTKLTKDDASLCYRLVFNDAATYDPATKTGGFDGSIVMPEELSRPENKMLEPVVKRLAEAKAEIDSKAGEAGPISWADLLVLAVRVTTLDSWKAVRVENAKGDQERAALLSSFGAPFEVQLGRIDGSAPGPAGKIPAPDASVEEIKEFLNRVGNKDPDATRGSVGNPFKPQAPWGGGKGFMAWTSASLDPMAEEARLAEADSYFAGQKKAFDRSRATVTRTNYEVTFVETFTALSSLGARFDRKKYCVPIKLEGEIRL